MSAASSDAQPGDVPGSDDAPASPADSRVETMHIVMPGHINGTGRVIFGGVIMQWIDVAAGMAAMRHARGDVVTASIDRVDFLSAVPLGAIVVLEAQVNYTGKSSMEVGCNVETEDPGTRTRRRATQAYLTFVAVDERGKPRRVPPLRLVTADDQRRWHEAEARRAERLRAAGRSS